MNNNNLYSNKYMILTAALLILLMVLTIKAFNYIPQPIDDKLNYQNETQQETVNQESENKIDEKSDDEDDSEEDEEEDDDDVDTDDEDDETDNHHKHGHIDYMPAPKSYTSESRIMDIDEIQAPKGTNEEKINAVED